MQPTRSDRRRRRPSVESLEGRQLLSGGKTILAKTGQPINDKDLARLELQLENDVPWKERRFRYTYNGNDVVVTLYGMGTLLAGKPGGTHVDADGRLHLVFDNTTNASRIIAAVRGPHGRRTRDVIPLASVRDADSPPGSTSGEGVDPIGALQMTDFGLVPGGRINLAGGVLEVNLRQIAADTALYLKEGVPVVTAGRAATTIVTGGASIGGITPVVAVAQQTTVDASGTTGLQIRIDRVLANPQGVVVNGRRQALGNPQIYTVDPTPGASRLLRFDAMTGQLVAQQALPALGSTQIPVGLSLRSARNLVLVGDGTQVLAYDLDLNPVGSFDASNLAGITSLTGIGSSPVQTILTSLDGPAYAIDVDQSLASGSAVVATAPNGTPIAPFFPQREFLFNGDASGLAGSNTLYASGAGHFDTAQPNLFQFGSMALTPVGPLFVEAARNAVSGIFSPFQNAGPTGLLPNPTLGLGSIDGLLARLNFVGSVGNTLTLFTAANAPSGTTILLQGVATPLSGLSESAHPELDGAAIIDVQGNMKRFVGKQVRGLVLNARGSINLIAAHTVVNSAFVGRPLNHVEFVNRRRSQVISTARGINGQVIRGGVTVQKNLLPDGPLMLPERGLV
ncbi:MAG: hypothetical protein KatS3mg108_0463 [Isosphaeraceae bacterium]|jgi:hypothetical protein|nr:MAG: hypothetical protein KatS3mg108_0463 [Isosphaeraceae bacterium]